VDVYDEDDDCDEGSGCDDDEDSDDDCDSDVDPATGIMYRGQSELDHHAANQHKLQRCTWHSANAAGSTLIL